MLIRANKLARHARKLPMHMMAFAIATVALVWVLSVSLPGPGSATFEQGLDEPGEPDRPAPNSQTLAQGSNPEPQMSTSPAIPTDPAPEPAQTPCGVTKVSMLYGGHAFSQLQEAQELHRKHSERWACGWVVLDRDISSRKLYSKHYILLSTMLQELAKPEESRQQWLLWVDADSIVVNPALSPAIFLPPDQLQNVYALVTADHNGLNNGIFFMRVHTQSVDLLTEIAAYPLIHPTEDLGWFGEQAAMAHVIEAKQNRSRDLGEESGIVWVPRTWFNHYEFEHGFEGEPGSFMVHFAGLGATRIDHMADWLNELHTNAAKWEIPLKDTVYNSSIPEFWAQYEAKTAHSRRSDGALSELRNDM